MFEKFVHNPTCKENLIDAYLLISNCYKLLRNKEKYKENLFKILEIDIPNAQVCCFIGDYFLCDKQYKQANFWYKQAIKSKKNEISLAFVNDIYYNYYPYLQMCVSYYNMHDLKSASFYNEKAGKVLESEAVKINREIFNALK